MSRPPLIRMLLDLLGRTTNDTRGTTAVEYGLILTFVAVAMLVGLSKMSTGITDTFAIVESYLNGTR